MMTNRETILAIATEARREGRNREATEILRSLPSRNWHAEHDERGISIGEGFSFSRKVHLVNPTEKRFHDGRAYVLWFGACGPTYLHVYARCLEDALEECAGRLAEYAPGCLVSPEEHEELVREAVADADLEWPGDESGRWEDGEYQDALQSAEADLTYTESGWLTSYEWGLALERPTTEDLYRFIGGE